MDHTIATTSTGTSPTTMTSDGPPDAASRKNGAQLLWESVIRERVEVIFGIPGGAVLPLYDKLTHYTQLRHVLCRNEQGAAYAADAYARAAQRVGVCLATSGPGATNLVTGIANAYLDGSPLVAITGQAPRALLRKNAFQEVDIIGITRPITKGGYLVMDPRDIPRIVREAFLLARSGKPGPVVIDLPKDVQQEEVDCLGWTDQTVETGQPALSEDGFARLGEAVRLLKAAKRPVVVAGRGVSLARAQDQLQELVDRIQAPVATSLLGLGCFPQDSRLSLGMLGMHGAAPANKAVQRADLILAVGTRLNDRITGSTSGFAPGARIVHIDIDANELGKNVRVDVPVPADAGLALEALLDLLEPIEHTAWLAELESWPKNGRLPVQRDEDPLLPQFVMQQIDDAVAGDAVVVTGIGQHQMWAAHYLQHTHPNGFISAGGLGPMGFELAGAVGAQVARANETVWCIAGDGGFQMTMQELGTIAEQGLPIKIAIINNRALGMVRQWQELFYDRSYVATILSNPDFVALAASYGIPGERVTRASEVGPAIRRSMEHEGCFLIDFAVDPAANVYPMVRPGDHLGNVMQ
ncbi:MAG: biosynthetic-type acetolactate synthase large subunit [Chloroflexota bacterium]